MAKDNFQNSKKNKKTSIEPGWMQSSFIFTQFVWCVLRAIMNVIVMPVSTQAHSDMLSCQATTQLCKLIRSNAQLKLHFKWMMAVLHSFATLFYGTIDTALILP